MATRPPPTSAPSSGEPSTPIRSRARDAVVDATILVGIGVLSYGSWLAYPPAGFIVGGLVLLLAGLNGSRR